jgi:LacI family transcriptional regulator
MARASGTFVAGSRRRVAVLVETSMASGRQILQGIARYARENGSWIMSHEPGHMQDVLPDWVKHWRGEGIIARVRSRHMAVALGASRIPVVDVLGGWPHPKIPLVQVSDAGVARLAAGHLMDRGFRRFAFCGIEKLHWAGLRRDAFVSIVTAAGYPCEVTELPPRGTPAWFAQKDRQRLARWIEGLPKPVGIMACNDLAGQRVLDACRRAGVNVPEEAAVLGVDNDESLCEVSDPRLSSIIPVHDHVGYEAARVLQRLMEGKRATQQELLLDPTEVVVRRSTDILAIDDPELAAAMGFIRDHACEGIGAEDVVRYVGVSYSTLKRRFRSVLKRSIHDEIIRIRLDRVKELLVGTRLSLASVARKTGFEHQEYLGAVFKTHVGMTPNKFRSNNRPHAVDRVEQIQAPADPDAS